MNDEFDGSFKIYVDAHPKQEQPGGNDLHPHADDSVFSQEVENVKEDVKSVEKLYEKLQEYNEEIKTAQNAKTMKEVRGHLNTDLDYLVKLAKQIDKKFDALVRANAALRMKNKNEDEMITEVRENLSQMMRKFQGMRAHTETEHRQLIESRYYAVTKQKATAEAIDSLIANVEETTDTPLHQAMQEQGKYPVLDTVAEIQERRDTMMEIRKNLMLLHQILSGIATPEAPPPLQVDDQLPNKTVVVNMPAIGKTGGGTAGGMATSGGLNDYERETRNQAYIAICIALILIISLTVIILKLEPSMETVGANMSQL